MLNKLTPFEKGMRPFRTGEWGFNELIDYINTYNEKLQSLGGTVPTQLVSLEYLALTTQVHLLSPEFTEHGLRDVLSHI